MFGQLAQVTEVGGGLGIFLLGVTIMTSGLRGLAGVALQSALTRFTRSPVSGVFTGAISTAILQSSSAMIVAAVGFVGAGLLTFPQALGIVMGANIGTTITGWLVALLGFKFSLGTAILPFILIGALLHLFTRGKIKQLGLAVAGFGLIFVGIASMQSGMSVLQGDVTSFIFSADTYAGRLKLVFVGLLITLITQSSSAGIAATLTALHTGNLDLYQSASLVIGMDIGTTVTALLATIGGSVEMRRTGFSHFGFNLIIGSGAFFLLTTYMSIWERFSPETLTTSAEIVVVAFHTSMNVLGVMLLVPIASQFAQIFVWLVPDKADDLTGRLDRQLLKEPSVALEAAHRTEEEIFLRLLSLGRNLTLGIRDNEVEFEELRRALTITETFLSKVASSPEHDRNWAIQRSCLHALDHMYRLCKRLMDAQERTEWWSSGEAKILAREVGRFFREQHDVGRVSGWAAAAEMASVEAQRRQEWSEAQREDVLDDVASGKLDVDEGDQQLNALRWAMRVSHHVWRIGHHLGMVSATSFKSPEITPPEG